ncbi:hypothetical protein PR048_006466 [Dryococelus australis]|uniref:Uncharacterized protein n=1 Tax=Dryococelus australis TaxID=614101 RepID=A0ABQ9IB15_9NEOP|nr:hypothetical protein PR048_006466 [Dryococelus australis]
MSRHPDKWLLSDTTDLSTTQEPSMDKDSHNYSALLKVIFSNMYSHLQKPSNLIHLIYTHQLYAMSLGETWLTPSSPFQLPEYIRHRSDCDGHSSGLALLIKSSITHYFHLIPTSTAAEVVAVHLHGHPYAITIKGFES